MVDIKEIRNKERRDQEEKFDKTEENLVRKGLIHSSPPALSPIPFQDMEIKSSYTFSLHLNNKKG